MKKRFGGPRSHSGQANPISQGHLSYRILHISPHKQRISQIHQYLAHSKYLKFILCSSLVSPSLEILSLTSSVVK